MSAQEVRPLRFADPANAESSAGALPSPGAKPVDGQLPSVPPQDVARLTAERDAERAKAAEAQQRLKEVQTTHAGASSELNAYMKYVPPELRKRLEKLGSPEEIQVLLKQVVENNEAARKQVEQEQAAAPATMADVDRLVNERLAAERSREAEERRKVRAVALEAEAKDVNELLATVPEKSRDDYRDLLNARLTRITGTDADGSILPANATQIRSVWDSVSASQGQVNPNARPTAQQLAPTAAEVAAQQAMPRGGPGAPAAPPGLEAVKITDWADKNKRRALIEAELKAATG